MPFRLTIRPDSLDWLDEVARVCGWSREQAARQALSEGRRVLTLKLAPTPERGRLTPPLRVVPADRVPAAGEPEDAATPA